MLAPAYSWPSEQPATVLLLAPYSDLVDISNLILGIGTVACALFVLIAVVIGLVRRKLGRKKRSPAQAPDELNGILQNLGITLPDGGKPAAGDDEEINPPNFE